MFYGQLERFGYMLTVISETKEGAKKALLKAYRRAYRISNNGARPTKEELECVNDELYIDEFKNDEVYWL